MSSQPILTTIKFRDIKKYKMATVAVLMIRKIANISATYGPILTKFGTVMPLGPPGAASK